MRYRSFGGTGARVSEVSFGAWAIGGRSFGEVSDSDSIQALSAAEALGCNFVDTAAVYGRSEKVLGEFLKHRRDRWFVATKYSKQPAGMTATLESQLRLLKTDYVDLYQLHWAPGREQYQFYEELERLKESGKVRFIGVSLYTTHDIDFVLDHTRIDSIQVKLSLLDPLPVMQRLEKLQSSSVAVIIRSAFHDGFLSGKYGRETRFTDPHDNRSRWSASRVRDTARMVERFRALENETGSLLVAAVRYVLTLPVVSTLILSTKSADQAAMNFSPSTAGALSPDAMRLISDTQHDLGLFSTGWRARLLTLKRRLASAMDR